MSATSTTLAARVRANAAAQRAKRPPREHDGRWLNSALAFDPDLSCEAPGLLNDLLGERRVYKRTAWERDLSILLGNLIAAAHAGRPLMLSLNDSDYDAPARYRRARRKMIDLVHALHSRGLIALVRGVRLPHLCRRARAWARPALLSCLPEGARALVQPPAEPIEVRQSESGRLMDYSDTPDSEAWRRALAALNTINGATRVKYFDADDNLQSCAPYMRAVFDGALNGYGRLECRAQRIPLRQRRSLRIDGRTTVEIGYRALPLHMLYANVGIQCLRDPYADVINGTPGMRAGGPFAPTRSYLQRVLLSMLGAASVDIDARARLWMEALEREHPLLAEYSDSRVGLALLNRATRLQMDVLRYFAAQGIPIIPVYDSFIVRELHAVELWQVMHEVYQRCAQGFVCPILGPRRFAPADLRLVIATQASAMHRRRSRRRNP